MSKITLRSAYKTKTYYFTPCKNEQGMYPSFVKKVRVNANGDSEMILSERDLREGDPDTFIPEDLEIKVEDGTTFDLDNPLQRSKWEAIKNSPLIAPERGARDAKGNLLIDGDKKRYGIAELWVEVPGEESEKRVKKTKKIVMAQNFILEDSLDGMLVKCKLLGKNMSNAPSSDVTDFLLSKASSQPDLIIDLYTGQDTQLRLLLVEALNKRVVYIKDGVFLYGDTILGVTEPAVLLFFKDIANREILASIRRETFPNMVRTAESVQMSKVDTSSKESTRGRGRKTEE